MLPYTAEILFSSLAQYNAALWPLPAAALVLALGAILLALRPMPGGDRIIAAILAAGWLGTGIGYHLLFFSRLDFAAPLYGALFVVEGVLWLWGASRGGFGFRLDRNALGWAGLLVALLALAWPLVDLLSGYPWRAGRIAGLAPAPTVLLTFGILLLATGRPRLHLAVIPLLWTLGAGAAGWILWIPQDLALPLFGLVGFGLLGWRKWRYPATPA